MDDMMKIHLLIDNERYPMTIRREDEQLYRDAAKQIDNKLNKDIMSELNVQFVIADGTFQIKD